MASALLASSSSFHIPYCCLGWLPPVSSTPALVLHLPLPPHRGLRVLPLIQPADWLSPSTPLLVPDFFHPVPPRNTATSTLQPFPCPRGSQRYLAPFRTCFPSQWYVSGLVSVTNTWPFSIIDESHPRVSSDPEYQVMGKLTRLAGCKLENHRSFTWISLTRTGLILSPPFQPDSNITPSQSTDAGSAMEQICRGCQLAQLHGGQ